ncbi:hypothetical protein [Deinococcus arenicola]|uniref:Flagella basal body P-ring formation protein FlgA n=1 Tax=Deinococcus arenicola TaxID=2994950 RepID=A0ABU4DT25_9DEIO|nr:hypothetical protein [Deinococcus sp. ZS9-10]MDV6375035.1 hypothetical protein [Deinococcus sp. ZS9-10]
MKAARSFPFILLLAALGSAQRPEVLPPLTLGSLGRLAALLPLPGQLVTVMEKRPSLSTVDLQTRVLRVGGSPEALYQVIISAGKGVRAPYDPRLGISEEEYKRYLVFQEVLVSTSKTLKFPVLRDSGRVLFGNVAGLNGVLDGLSINLRTGEMRGPEGYSALPVPVVPSTAPDRVLPVRTGFQWKVIGSDATAGNGVKGTLNLLELESGLIILNYNRTSMINRRLNQGEVIVGYDR